MGVLAVLPGCAAELRERQVSDVQLVETKPSDVDVDEVLAGLATAVPKTVFLTSERRYDPGLVARDLERIERFYRARGYYDVKVIAARVWTVAPLKVVIEVQITPGARVTVRRVDIDQSALLALPPDVAFKYKQLRPINAGVPFDETLLDAHKSALEQLLKDSGFAYAKVRVRATVDLNARAADIMTELSPGKRCRFGEVRVVGLQQIPEGKVRAALELRRGEQYSETAQQDARQALGDMHLFTRVDLRPDLSNPDVDEVPVLVTLQEDQLRKLVLGGGTVIDTLKMEMHARTGWEHKNFFGGARRLNVDVTGGVDFFPWRVEPLKSLKYTPKLFPVFDANVSLEQPALFNGRTSGRIQTTYSMRPVLYSLNETQGPGCGSGCITPEQEVVIGYHRPSGRLALERSFLGQRIRLASSYNLEARIPLNYQNLPQGLETIWVSYPRLEAVFESAVGDLFEDRAKREIKLYFQNSLEVAGLRVGDNRLFGGSVSDVKVQPEVRLLVPLQAKRRSAEQKAGDVTLAARVKFGFLLAPDYGSSLRTDEAAANADGSQPIDSDQQKLLARAFYSGGANSNRGYSQFSISPHGPVGFLLPTSVNCTLPSNAEKDLCIRPLGGFTQWEASLELRYAGLYPITVVAFADAADVTRGIGTLDFRYPHLSVGPGVRYESPVGPIRLDFGIRVPGAQAWGQRELPISHGKERPDSFLGLPAALHLAIGDAF